VTAEWIRRYKPERAHEALGNTLPTQYLMPHPVNPLLLDGPKNEELHRRYWIEAKHVLIFRGIGTNDADPDR